MSTTPPNPPDDLPREPMPRSWRPVWVFTGLMALVVLVMGVAAAIIALIVRHATGG